MTASLKYRDDDADDRMAGTPSPLDYLPQLVVYPLTGFCLPVMIMISVFVLVGAQTLFGIPLLAITGVWMLHYLVAVIERTARGHATPPPLSGDAVFLGAGALVRALAGPLLVLTAYTGLQPRAPLAATLLVATAAFLAPAYLFSLAIDGRLRSALNPLRLAQIALALGLGYALPCLVLLLGALLILHLEHGGGLALVTLLWCYVQFLTAHLLGFLAYHRRDALELQVHVGDPDEKRRRLGQSARLEAVKAAIGERLNEHDLAGAARALHDEPGGPADLLEFHEDLLRWLGTRGEPALLHAQGRRLIGLLLDEKRDTRALEVYETCVNRHAAFQPVTAVHWLRLARAAAAAGMDRRFEELVDALVRHCPEDPVTTSAEFLRARTVSERGDAARARELLRPLLRRRAHPLHPQMMALARVLAPGSPAGRRAR